MARILAEKRDAAAPEVDEGKVPSTSRDARILDPAAHLDEVAIPSELITPLGGGRYSVNVAELAPTLRLLPDNPIRFIAKVKLAPGVDLATLVVDVLAPGDAIEVSETSRAATGRDAVDFSGPFGASASVTLRRAVVIPTPTPTPTPAATPTPAPSPPPASPCWRSRP